MTHICFVAHIYVEHRLCFCFGKQVKANPELSISQKPPGETILLCKGIQSEFQIVSPLRKQTLNKNRRSAEMLMRF